jgi:hypothetical protein
MIDRPENRVKAKAKISKRSLIMKGSVLRVAEDFEGGDGRI